MTAGPFSLVLVGMLGLGAGETWIPRDCPGRTAEVREHYRLAERSNPEAMRTAFEKAVREAKPGSPVYTPKPFPKTEEEILEDFRFAYLEILFGKTPRDELRAEERPIYDAVAAGSIGTRIETVAGWSLQRCSPERPAPYFYLIRLFDPASGVEVSRMALHYTGLWARYGHRDPKGDGRHRIPDLARLSELLVERFDRSSAVARAQLVVTDGMPRCDLLTPCIAYEEGSDLYVLETGARLYLIEQAGGVGLTPPVWRDTIAGREPDLEQGFVSLGFGFAPSRLVAGSVE